MRALVYDVDPIRWTVCKIAGRVTPRVFWSKLSGLGLREVAIPALPNPQWVRLRTVLGGVCGTDLSTILQRSHPASILQAVSSFPAVLGHENVAVVDEVGDGVRSFKPGDRVVVESSLSCVPRGIEPVCAMCTAGRFTLCRRFQDGDIAPGSMIGYHRKTGGSWGPHFVAHQSQLHRVPDTIDDKSAVLVDPIAGAVHAVLRRVPADNETVLILGAGLLGIGIAIAIRALGSRCRLFAIVRRDEQATLMTRFGVDETITVRRSDTQADRYERVGRSVGARPTATRFGHCALLGGGYDVVYDCVGTGDSLTDALKYTRAGGTTVEVGTSNISIVDTAPLWLNERNVIGANCRAIESYEGKKLHTYEIVLEWLAAGRIDLSGLLTHTFRIDQYAQAFETLTSRDRRGAAKVAFAFSS
mgnify:CR=1 FL=1